MTVVKKVVENDIGEITGILAMKGKTREMVKRHTNSVIPLFSERSEDDPDETSQESRQDPEERRGPRRRCHSKYKPK